MRKKAKSERVKPELINAAITIFEASGDPKGFPAYVDIHHLFKRGEAVGICERALADGPLDTRQLALAVIRRRHGLRKLRWGQVDLLKPCSYMRGWAS